MSNIKFSNIGIMGLSATVPKNTVVTLEQTEYFEPKKLYDFVAKTGISERRIAPDDLCASDLCFLSATKLIESLHINKEELGALIFVSQTPDYRQPATSILLQNRLDLPTNIFSLDINQACSGFIWGMFLAYSLVNSGLNNILLLVGDTPSKITSPKDSATALMFGDGGIAAIINKDGKYGDSYFSLNTDGSAFNAVNVPGGGFRNMSSLDTLTYKKYADGSEKTDEQIHMDGMDVFSYSISAMSKDVRNLLNFANKDIGSINKFVLHQANKFMNDLISKKLKIDNSKSLYSIQKYGNTSSISIPLTMADQNSLIENKDELLFTAIGAGFTWGSAIIKLIDCKILDVNEI